MPPVGNQGDIGACLSWTICKALMYEDGPVDYKYSELAEYYNGRVLAGTADEDSGLTVADGFKAAKNSGIPEDVYWPYITSKFTDKPSDEAYENGLKHRIAAYGYLNSLDEIKRAIGVYEHPVIVGINVFKSIYDDDTTKTGQIKLPDCNEESIGGHGILIVGYDDNMKFDDGHVGGFVWSNHWGEDWGDSGYGYIPYKYYTKGYMWDASIIKKLA